MTTLAKKNALVVLSGGQDSTTCLGWAKSYFNEVHAITINYGQRHSIELEAAKRVAKLLKADSHKILDVGKVLVGTSPLVSDNELDQYKDHDSLPGGLEKTFVPMRNQFFLTIAANHAYAMGITDLVTGVCQEDFGGYPDCRRVFIDALEDACNKGTFTGEDGALPALTIHTPLMDLSKAESVDLALTIPDVYGALAFSHTAYDGKYPPTGKDHATLLREKGFYEAGVPDPLILRAVMEGVMPMPSAANYTPELVAVYNPLVAMASSEL